MSCRVTVITADGTVVADNEADPATGWKTTVAPEISAAVTQGEGSSVRAAQPVHEELLYFAPPDRRRNGRQRSSAWRYTCGSWTVS